jgi:hypothetical protein
MSEPAIEYATIKKGVCTGCGATDGSEGCDGDYDFCWIHDPKEREAMGLAPEDEVG